MLLKTNNGSDLCDVSLTVKLVAPQVHPVLAHVEGVPADGIQHVLLDKLGAVALDEVEAPALKADIIFQVVQPVLQVAAQILVQVVQIWMRRTPVFIG